MINIQEIQAARKRAASMGKPHAWRLEFDRHAMAACIDNHIACIDAEMENAPKNRDFIAMLVWLHNMSKRINVFCDAHKIAGDEAAEYWLERFLWRADFPIQMDPQAARDYMTRQKQGHA
jgi:hypothetical protein